MSPSAALRTHADPRTPAGRTLLAASFLLSVLAGALLSPAILEGLDHVFRAEPAPLRSIAVQGNQHLSTREVAVATGIDPAASDGEISIEAVEARLESHPWILSARALQLPTGRLLVRIQERTPVALLCSPHPCDGDETGWLLVDAYGTPFANVLSGDDRTLPRIVGRRALATRETDPDLARAVSLQDRLPAAGSARAPAALELPEASSSEGWVLHLSSPAQRVLLGSRDLEARLERLEWLLAADLASAREAEVIDLRFAERAVLRSASASR